MGTTKWQTTTSKPPKAQLARIALQAVAEQATLKGSLVKTQLATLRDRGKSRRKDREMI